MINVGGTAEALTLKCKAFVPEKSGQRLFLRTKKEKIKEIFIRKKEKTDD